MKPPFEGPFAWYLVCNRWLERPQLIRCFCWLRIHVQRTHSIIDFSLVCDHTLQWPLPFGAWIHDVDAVWKVFQVQKVRMHGDSLIVSVRVSAEVSYWGSFTCFASHLLYLSLWLQRERFRRANICSSLLQHLPPGYKHCQINLREQLISEYASWCGMTSTSKRTLHPPIRIHTAFSECNLAIPMTSNDIHPMKAANLKSNDYYEVLGVLKNANESEITKVASHASRVDPSSYHFVSCCVQFLPTSQHSLEKIYRLI